MLLPRDDSPVFVPACPGAGKRGMGIETRRLESGERAGLAFSSPAALAEQLGSAQPWICLPMRGYAEFLRANGINRVQCDPVLREDIPRWSTGALVSAYGENGGR